MSFYSKILKFTVNIVKNSLAAINQTLSFLGVKRKFYPKIYRFSVIKFIAFCILFFANFTTFLLFFYIALYMVLLTRRAFDYIIIRRFL